MDRSTTGLGSYASVPGSVGSGPVCARVASVSPVAAGGASPASGATEPDVGASQGRGRRAGRGTPNRADDASAL